MDYAFLENRMISGTICYLSPDCLLCFTAGQVLTRFALSGGVNG